MSDEEGLFRVTAMISFILGFLQHQEASDEEVVAIGLFLCARIFERNGTTTQDATREFAAGIDALRANSKPFN